MCNIVFDYLSDSFLFRHDFIADNYSAFTKEELALELQRYREYVIRNFSGIVQEVSKENNLTNVAVETFRDLPGEDKLKRLALYMNQIVVGDPLFKETEKKGDHHGAMSEFMGLDPGNEIDRRSISNAANYMKRSAYLVESRFVRFLPVSLLNEAPMNLPLLYSDTNFSDVFSRDLYKWFHGKAKVYNVYRDGGCLRCDISKPLSLGTTIHVDFGPECFLDGMIYQFVCSKVESLNPQTYEVLLRQYIPDSISQIEFDAWVENSINRASMKVYKEVFNEALFAKQANCMYLTESSFSAHLLNSAAPTNDLKSDIASLSMELELPIFEELPLHKIIDLRCNYGQAFQNFRKMLGSKLAGLRNITDPVELKLNLENVAFELSEVQIQEVNKEFRNIIRSLRYDALLLTGSLIASFCTGGLTMIGAVGAVAKGGLDYAKYLSDVRENDGFFLWKVNREARGEWK